MQTAKYGLGACDRAVKFWDLRRVPSSASRYKSGTVPVPTRVIERQGARQHGVSSLSMDASCAHLLVNYTSDWYALLLACLFVCLLAVLTSGCRAVAA